MFEHGVSSMQSSASPTRNPQIRGHRRRPTASIGDNDGIGCES